MSLLSLLKFVTTHPITADRRARAILRLATWQLRSRLAAGPIVHDWIGGARFLVKRGDTGLTGNIYTGLHEFADMGYLLHAVRDDDLFVDVGANLGSYTLLACAVRRARGVAFEPVPGTYARLVDNIRLNRLEDRVTCLNLGVAAQAGTLAFTSDMDTVNHAVAQGERHDHVVDVEVTTLDRALDGAVPGLMKIDVEGFEAPVLEGATRTLQDARLHSVIMELNGSGSHYGFDESRILSAMHSLGFRTFSYDPATRALRNLEGRNAASGNTLFIRNEPLVRERLATAPRLTILGKTI